MKHYSKAQIEQKKRVYYRCPRPCYNITFSALPDSKEPLTEAKTCTCCGRKIEFSTVAMPKKIGNPISRRKWGTRTPILSDTLRDAVKNWQNLTGGVK